jgi:hypothetical protein
MSLLSKLFRKKILVTPLEEFIGPITLAQCETTYHDVTNKSSRLPAALSTYALYLAHDFSSGLREMLSNVDKHSTFANNRFPYDAVAFEAAAYCYYWLMRDMLNTDNEDEYEGYEDDKGEDIYLECLKDSAHMTSYFLNEKVPFDLSNDLLMKRIISYSFEETRKSVRPEAKFFQFLISSMQSGSPLIRTNVSMGSSLKLEVTVVTRIQTFEASVLATFKKSANDLFLADKEGRL